MEHHVLFLRLVLLTILLFLITSDLKDLLDALSNTKTLGPYIYKKTKEERAVVIQDDYDDDEEEEDDGQITKGGRKQLVKLKSHLTKVMQEWCLPKLVCELHASVGENRYRVSEAEQGLLSIIKDTSLINFSPSFGGISSKYHFAAHMGSLLADVEGNGCHNLYPNCPLTGKRVLQMVKKVKLS